MHITDDLRPDPPAPGVASSDALAERVFSAKRPGSRLDGVVVQVKRRRAVVASELHQSDSERGDQHAPVGSREARIFRVETQEALSPSTHDVPTLSVQEIGSGIAKAVASAQPAPRRRRHKDPTRAPGLITKLVFAGSAGDSSPATQKPVEDAGGFVGNLAGWNRAIADLESVRVTLDLAMRAKAFRIL